MEFFFQIDKSTLMPDLKRSGKIKPDIVEVDSKWSYLKKSGNDWMIWVGDFVRESSTSSPEIMMEKLLATKQFDVAEIIKTGGAFYCIHYEHKDQKIRVLTGFLNILPIYYYQEGETLFVSSSAKMLADHCKTMPSVSYQFLVEKLLFNYPFTEKSIYQGITSLEGNHFLEINSQGFSGRKHTNIDDWIVTNPKPVKSALPDLTNYFNERVANYFPDEEYYLSFTSGFDGRTLLSAALNKSTPVIAYSFGVSQCDDIMLPTSQSAKLGITFHPFQLDKDEYLKQSYELGLELVESSEGLSNLARAHYLYAASLIGKKHNYIVTGNFGSELFRAFRVTGVMVTPFLFKLFTHPDPEEFLNKYPFTELDVLNNEVVNTVLPELKNDLLSSEYLQTSSFTQNQRFYKIVFEIVFRKYFGAEIKAQSKHVLNRTPFIDYEFLKRIFRSELAGQYTDFYESNPAKRMKGQMLYANIIRNNSEKLYKLKTGKGYRPSDLLSLTGKINLLKGKFTRKFKPGIADEFGVRKALEYNRSIIEQATINRQIFKKDIRKESAPKDNLLLNNYINVLSLNHFINNFTPNG